MEIRSVQILIAPLLLATVLLFGCAGPSGPDDDDSEPAPEPTPGNYSVLLEAEELGLAALEVHDGGDLSTVVLSDLGYPYNYNQVVAAVDSIGGYAWYRSFPSGWVHCLFRTSGGWTAVGFKPLPSEFTQTELWVTTMGPTGGTKRSRSISLPDSLAGAMKINDAVMTTSGDILLTGVWFDLGSGDEINDVDALVASLNLTSDAFDWVTRFGDADSLATHWFYGDLIGLPPDGQFAIIAGRETEFDEVRGDLLLLKCDAATGEVLRDNTAATRPERDDKTPLALAVDDAGGPCLLLKDDVEGDEILLAFGSDLSWDWGASSTSIEYTSLDYAQGQFIVGQIFSSGNLYIGTEENGDHSHSTAWHYLFDAVGEVMDVNHLEDGSWIVAGRVSQTGSVNDALSWVARSDSADTFWAPDTVVNVPH